MSQEMGLQGCKVSPERINNEKAYPPMTIYVHLFHIYTFYDNRLRGREIRLCLWTPTAFLIATESPSG